MAPASLYTLLAQYRRATARVRSVGTFGGRPVEVKVATELPRYYAARQPAGGTVEAENGGGARHENVRVCLSVKVSTEDPLSTKPPSRVVVEVTRACHAKPAAAPLPPPRRRRTQPSGPQRDKTDAEVEDIFMNGAPTASRACVPYDIGG